MSGSCSIHRMAGALALVALATTGGCVTRGYPTHGGGKRFFQEQALVAGSVDGALAQIDFARLAKRDDGTPRTQIAVHVFAVAHSGGGVQTSGTGFLGSLFGAVPVLGAGQQAGGGAVVPVVGATAATGSGYFAFGFESADDMRYLMGRVIAKLGAAHLRVETPKEMKPDQEVLCILVSQLGIDQSDFNALVYSEKVLRARTQLEAFLVTHEQDADDPNRTSPVARLIGTGTSTMRFREDFFLGFGPISGGTPEIDATEDGR